MGPGGLELYVKRERVVITCENVGCWQIDNPAVIRHGRFSEECNVITILVKDLQFVNREKRCYSVTEAGGGGSHLVLTPKNTFNSSTSG
jgi:hypothetical protein